MRLSNFSTYNSRIRMTSRFVSKTSYSFIMLAWLISLSRCISLRMSSILAPRRPPPRRFLMNLAAYSSPLFLCVHRFTVANWPLENKEYHALIHKALEKKTAEFANTVNPDEVAHNEPPHLYLHCLPASL